MAIDAIVRVSFQSNVRANQAANNALVGHVSESTGPGPFERTGTATYSANSQPDENVHDAIAALMVAVRQHHADLDFLSITLSKRRDYSYAR